MNPLARLFERARAEFTGLGEAIVGNQAQRIIDQEIRDVDAQLHGWRNELGVVQAQRLVARERRDATAQQIEAREAQAVLALQAGDPGLARDVAAAIVLLERQRDDDDQQVSALDDNLAQMRRIVAQSENALRRLRHQLDALRATESVQRAQEAVARRDAQAPGVLRTALDAAQRARAATPGIDRLVDETAIDAAFAELDDRLRRAGIGETDLRTEAVMQRIQARMPAAPARNAKPSPRSKR